MNAKSFKYWDNGRTFNRAAWCSVHGMHSHQVEEFPDVLVPDLVGLRVVHG